MAYENLKTAIKQTIKQNGNQEITGNLLQSTLLNIVNTLGADYKFLGFATPSTVPPTSEEGRLFYFASEAGEYINFPTSDENTYITIGEGLYLFTKEANSNYWKEEILIEIVQELGKDKSKAISQKALLDSLNYLRFSICTFSFNIEHSSTVDRIKLNIKRGEIVSVNVSFSDESKVLNAAIFYTPANSSDNKDSQVYFKKSGTYELIAPEDIDSIGLYVHASSKISVTYSVAASKYNISYAILAGNKTDPDIDTVNHTMTFPTGSGFYVNNICYGFDDDADVKLKSSNTVDWAVTGDDMLESSTRFIVLNVDTLALEVYRYNSKKFKNGNKYPIGSITSVYRGKAFTNASFPFSFTIDGKNDVSYAILAGNKTDPDIDTVNHTMTFPTGSGFYVNNICYGFDDDADVKLKSSNTVDWAVTGDDMLESSTRFIVLNVDTLALEVYRYNSKKFKNGNKYPIGSITSVYRGKAFTNASFPFSFTIDGKNKHGNIIENFPPRLSFLNLDISLYDNIGAGYYGGATCYKDKVFIFKTNSTNITIYDLSSKHAVTVDSGLSQIRNFHSNNANFSNYKYQENDEFPLLYLSELDSAANLCYVLRIKKVEDQYTFSIVQTIHYPTRGSYGSIEFDAMFDFDNSIMILCSVMDKNYSDREVNAIQYFYYNLPDFKANQDVNISADDIIGKSHKFINMPTYQGGFCHKGIIYQAFGTTTKKIFLLNVEKGTFINYIDVEKEIDCAELEGCFMHSNCLYAYDTEGNIIKIS